jgi:hypothetical protein
VNSGPDDPDRVPPRTGWGRIVTTCVLAGLAGASGSFAAYSTATAEGMETLVLPMFWGIALATLGLWALTQWRSMPRGHWATLLPLLVAVVAGGATLAPELADDIRRDHEHQLRVERSEREAAIEERAAADDRERQQQQELADTGRALRDHLTRLWRQHRDDTGEAVGPWSLDPPDGHDAPLAAQALDRVDPPVPVTLFDTNGDGMVDRVQIGDPPDVRCMTAATYDREPTGVPYLGGPMVDAPCDGDPVRSDD